MTPKGRAERDISTCKDQTVYIRNGKSRASRGSVQGINENSDLFNRTCRRDPADPSHQKVIGKERALERGGVDLPLNAKR